VGFGVDGLGFLRLGFGFRLSFLVGFRHNFFGYFFEIRFFRLGFFCVRRFGLVRYRLVMSLIARSFCFGFGRSFTLGGIVRRLLIAASVAIRMLLCGFVGMSDIFLSHCLFAYLESALKSFWMALLTISSTTAKYAAKAKTAMITTTVVARTCFQLGQVTRRISICSSSK
jgi:hypothetical protein